MDGEDGDVVFAKSEIKLMARDGGANPTRKVDPMALSREEIERRWQRVNDADTDDFATLVKVAALDPARHLRRAVAGGIISRVRSARLRFQRRTAA